MGCADLALLGPYFRAILDRLDSGVTKRRRLLFDVGANTGQDADAIMGNFHRSVGMCKSFSTPFTVVSIEPSPNLFCEIEKLVKKRGWEPRAQGIIRLNIGMSNKTGFLPFQDPGNEGGRLLRNSIRGVSSLGDTMTELEFESITRCTKPEDQSIDSNRITTVPTYTMDTLVPALETLKSVNLVRKGNEIFILKVDTEGHDKFVIQGARNLLAQKRIVFVLFEVWSNTCIRDIAEFVDTYDYECFIISPKVLIPVHPEKWWYEHLDKNSDEKWWGNGICGIRGSSSLSMLFRMYHSDNDFLLNAHDHVVG